jgi:hypothetical protein
MCENAFGYFCYQPPRRRAKSAHHDADEEALLKLFHGNEAGQAGREIKRITVALLYRLSWRLKGSDIRWRKQQRFDSADDIQLHNIVTVMNTPVQDRVFDRIFEPGRRTNPVARSKSATVHCCLIGKPILTRKAFHDLIRRQHGRNRSFLIHLPLPAEPCPGPQDQPVPMPLNVLIVPKIWRYY